MKTNFAIALIFTLAACGDSTPPPKPAAPAAPPPQAEAPAAKAPETKAAEAPKPDPNKELARRVKQALEGDGKIQGAGIDVTATDGKVTLWGTTATPGERSRAGQIAAKVDGVSAVDNQLKVVKGS
jgi:hyperosmotically inducible periplasmic protein